MNNANMKKQFKIKIQIIGAIDGNSFYSSEIQVTQRDAFKIMVEHFELLNTLVKRELGK